MVSRSSATVSEQKESTGLIARLGLAALCLVAAFSYRASVSLIPTGIWEDAFLLGLAALFLAIAVAARRRPNLHKYWEIPFAFFVFTIAGFAADVSVSPIQQGFVRGVLHEAPTTNNPLASTVMGTVLVQVFSTLCIVVPIVLLTKASGGNLSSIFICKAKNQVGLFVGLIGFAAFFFLAARGRTASFFPNSGVTFSQFLALSPALIVLVLQRPAGRAVVPRAVPQEVREVLRSVALKHPRGGDLHLLPRPGPVRPAPAAVPGLHTGARAGVWLFDAKVGEHPRSGNPPRRLRHPDLPGLPFVRVYLTAVSFRCRPRTPVCACSSIG